MRAPTSPGQQFITGLAIAVVIGGTLMCGIMVALAETSDFEAAQARPTPTVFRIPSLPPTSGQSQAATQTPPPTLPITVIPTEIPPSATQPTASPTLTSTATPTWTPTARACQPRAGWVAYTVQPGDTLFLIGVRYGVTVTTMMAANCLGDDYIAAGQILLVPPVTPQAAPTSARTPTPGGASSQTATLTGSDGSCTNRDAIITSPRVWEILRGAVEIRGTARHFDFAFYKLEIRQEGTGLPFVTFYTSYQQVTDGTLAVLDTTAFPNGEFWLRLVVVDSLAGWSEPCSILVVFDN